MNASVTLLYLNGVGPGDLLDDSKHVLSASLARAGFAGLDGVRMVVPKYANTLRYPGDDKESLPPLTVGPPTGEAGRQFRRDFERRTARLELLLAPADFGSGWAGGEVLVDVGLAQNAFLQANRYLKDDQTRARTLNRVLQALPLSGRLVIVGHSLGSIIALDALRRLPKDLHVTGLITIGSPVAHRSFHVDRLKDRLTQPPSNLGWWVNFWSDGDVVTTHRGASAVFPWMLDQRLRLSMGAHSSERYLETLPVATAIGHAIFGSRSREIATIERGIEAALVPGEMRLLLALRYAHFISDRLKGEKRDRYLGALRTVQMTTINQLLGKYTQEQIRIPTQIARMSVEPDAPFDRIPVPGDVSNLDKSEAIEHLLSIAATNLIRPYEIEIPWEVSRCAMQDLSVSMKLGSVFGGDAFDAYRESKKALQEGSGGFDWLLLGVGGALLIAATGGLALAAAPSVAGAAAITSALAAFGPGGMVGGLLSAGTLVGAGGGSVAVALASSGTTVEEAEAVVALQLAASIQRKKQNLDLDPETRPGLVQTAHEVRRERARLEHFSDDKAPTVKALGKKLATVDRAIAYMDKNELFGDRDRCHA